VQEAWLRLSRAEAAGIDNLGGWLTTVVARVCLDTLRSRKSRREEPLEGEPQPAAGHERAVDPEREAELADSVGLALLVVLETLSPPERLAFGEDRPRAAGGFVRGLESEGAVADQQEAPGGSRPGARQSRRCILRRLRTALGATNASLGDTRVRAARLPRGRSGARATRRKGGRT
jgi:hypothetical protein